MKNFTLPSQSIRSLCRGKGYKSLTKIFLKAQQSMQKYRHPSGFFAYSMVAPHGDEDGHMAQASSNSSSFFVISSFSWGLCLYIDFLIGSAPSTSDILCMYLPASSWLVHVQQMYQGIHPNTYIIPMLINALLSSSTFSKCGIAPSGKVLYHHTIHLNKNNTRLPDIIKLFILCNMGDINSAIWKFILYQHYIASVDSSIYISCVLSQ